MTIGFNNISRASDRVQIHTDLTAPTPFSPYSTPWLIDRANELLLVASVANYPITIITTLDQLLQEARNRDNPVAVADLLRIAAIVRFNSFDGHLQSLEEAESLIEEMFDHSQTHGLVLHRANAHAIRSRKWILQGNLDDALTEVARAMAILDTTPPSASHGWTKAYSRAMVDCWFTLNQAGAFEAAKEIIEQIYPAIQETTSPAELTFILINRIRALVNWGLRLERINQINNATEKFRQAAELTLIAESALIGSSLFQQSSLDPLVAPCLTSVHIGVFSAAKAFHNPKRENIDVLKSLSAEEKFAKTTVAEDRVLLGIVLSRALRADNQFDAAAELLEGIHNGLSCDENSSPLQLSLLREIANLARSRVNPAEGSIAEISPTDPLVNYANALENELWQLRTIRISALNARCEHEKLAAQQNAIAQLALQDPLTELPNRRALEGHLHDLVTSADTQPVAIAVIDLDGFKEVNDRHCHDEGDRVLKTVAKTLQTSLRGSDIVARYGGDEFIVLLPNTDQLAARKILERVLIAVANLPTTHSHGVTLSVGLVSLLLQEPLPEALLRADKAMYIAKRNGGNQIAESGAVPEHTAPERSTNLTRYVSTIDEPLWPEEEVSEEFDPENIPGNSAPTSTCSNEFPVWPEEEPDWPDTDPE